MKTFIIWLLVTIMFTGMGAVCAGIGWIAAWVLDAGLEMNVDYNIFILVAVGIYQLKVPFIIFKLWTKKKEKEWEAEFNQFGKW
ncbi:hypothetical protein DFO70_13110 [Cytobacillus firmus]|uniref:Uncharacterized protein n=2 Tax=Cytobacillus TaxID=2675230 RepID=A0A366JI48_CYTFI|nr:MULTISPECIES: hypothetical protein [Cytobacillus]RBP86177.1 hypothetical protein DFO70_13110 [Cytobacillus firmus]TDX36410.1 hypothetical protein DFO72_12027 [Cytobacillus oceanisediminis]